MSRRKLERNWEERIKHLERQLRKRRSMEDTMSSVSSSNSSPPPVRKRRSRTKARRHRDSPASHRRREKPAPCLSEEDDVMEVWAIRSPSPGDDAAPGSPAREVPAREPRSCAAEGAPPVPSAAGSLEARAPPAARRSPSPAGSSAHDTSRSPGVSPSPQPRDEAADAHGCDPAPGVEPEEELDSELLEILGEDPSTPKTFGKQIQKEFAIRFEHTTTSGLSKDVRKELTEKFLIPINAKLIDAPTLNPEIKAALSDQNAKRDKALEMKQKSLARVISALGEALSITSSGKEKNSTVTRILMDASRLLCDCQYQESVTRRNFMLSSLKKDMKEQLNETKIDHFLFGENLSETLKAAKTINKSGAELKIQPVKSTTSKSAPAKNWRGPNHQHRRPTTHPPKRGPPTSKPRQSSFKPWQSRRAEPARR